MTPCVCGKAFWPTVEEYRAHIDADSHRAWRVREGIESVGVTPTYRCACGVIHWADTRIGRQHWALGRAA